MPGYRTQHERPGDTTVDGATDLGKPPAWLKQTVRMRLVPDLPPSEMSVRGSTLAIQQSSPLNGMRPLQLKSHPPVTLMFPVTRVLVSSSVSALL